MKNADSYQTLNAEREDELVWVTINRPDKLNALNDQVLSELDEVFDDIKNEEDIRGVMVIGSGEKAFVAGADIRELQKLDGESGKSSSRKGQQVFQKIENMPVPVMALVNGYALGGGAELALACHLRVASEKAVFGFPEVGLGLIPGYGGTQRLPHIVGRTLAIEMILTGEPIESEQALEAGLVNKVVDADKLTKEARGLMNAITNNAPLAIEKGLKAILQDSKGKHADGFENEAELFGELCESEDAHEGMSAFLEKRHPDFKGK